MVSDLIAGEIDMYVFNALPAPPYSLYRDVFDDRSLSCTKEQVLRAQVPSTVLPSNWPWTVSVLMNKPINTTGFGTILQLPNLKASFDSSNVLTLSARNGNSWSSGGKGSNKVAAPLQLTIAHTGTALLFCLDDVELPQKSLGADVSRDRKSVV